MVRASILHGFLTFFFCSFVGKVVSTISQTELFEAYGYPPKDASVKEFEFNVTHTYIAPDGKYRSGYLINGQQPGPAIITNQGDWVRVRVRNYTPVDITIHFHGILQRGTPWADGVPGVTQFPILSNDEYTHVFQIDDQYGAAWYHAHYRGYENDGINGPIYTVPHANISRPYSEIMSDLDSLKEIQSLELNPVNIMATDWFKLVEDDLMARLFEFGVDPSCIQSILVNGKGRITCYDEDTITSALGFRTDAYTNTFGGSLKFDTVGCLDLSVIDTVRDIPINKEALEVPGYSAPCQNTSSEREIIYTNHQNWLYLNVYNMGGEFTKLFSIDGHKLYLIAVDGIFVHPVEADQISIPVAGRYTVLVKLDATEKEDSDVSKPFAVRLACGDLPQVIEGISYLIYGFQNTTNETEVQLISNPSNGKKIQDVGGNLLSSNFSSIDLLSTKPYNLIDIPNIEPGDVTVNILLNRSGEMGFSVLESGYRMPGSMELQTPLLFQDMESNTFEMPNLPEVIDAGIQFNDIVDLIIDNTKTAGHPIHLHGHYVNLISYSASEFFPFTTIEEAIEANYSSLIYDSPKTDIFYVPPGGHIVARFVANNPGFWPIHCHITNHQFSGMMAILVEAKNDLPPIPPFLFDQSHAYSTLEDWDISDPRFENETLIY